ncbi:substrate-binding periplasmic protein [Chromobacterium vaccinii]|uniref:substrate-binding periplasmic protein n=1 Tax=Chromobacterium vaccinii TaxID=1108595 RepID=UPI003C7142A2
MRARLLLGSLRLMILLTGLAAPTRAADGDALTVAVDAGNPPFMYAGHAGAAGLYPLLIRRVSERAGLRVALQPLAWRRALYQLNQGQAAVGGIYKNSSREKLYDFSQPLFTERIVVIYPRQRPLPFHALADLDRKRVGVMAGWSYGDDFDRARAAGRFSAYDGESDQQNLQRLERGYLDAALGVREAMDAILASGDYPGLAIASEPLVANPTFLALRKQPGNRAVLQRFNQALEAMRQDGSYAALVRGFFSAGH